MKQFLYSIIADDFEKTGDIYKEEITEVYIEIMMLLEGRKAKNLKIEIKERKDDKEN